MGLESRSESRIRIRMKCFIGQWVAQSSVCKGTHFRPNSVSLQGWLHEDGQSCLKGVYTDES